MPQEFWKIWLSLFILLPIHEYVLFTRYFLVLSVMVAPNAVNNTSERMRIYFLWGGVLHSIIKHSGFISFRIDWFDFLAVQGTLKRLLQHHCSKASILWCSAFILVQFSHPDMIIGKTIALTIWTFVSKVMSLHFNILSRFVIAILKRSKRLRMGWLDGITWVWASSRRWTGKAGVQQFMELHRVGCNLVTEQQVLWHRWRAIVCCTKQRAWTGHVTYPFRATQMKEVTPPWLVVRKREDK